MPMSWLLSILTALVPPQIWGADSNGDVHWEGYRDGCLANEDAILSLGLRRHHNEHDHSHNAPVGVEII